MKTNGVRFCFIINFCVFCLVMKSVNSFDIYDTLIARRTCSPCEIFDIIEKELRIAQFKLIRTRTENELDSCATFDDIYDALSKKLNNPLLVLLLKNYEMMTEIKHSYLIETNCCKVKDGDILVSDMYYSNDQLSFILKCLGFNRNVSIYSSASCKKSKRLGNMYTYLQSQFQIKKHLGDNYESDVVKAQSYGITAELTTLSCMNENERFFMNNGLSDFAFFLREFRHSTIYPIDSDEYTLFHNQASYNLPMLVLISVYLHLLLRNEGRDTVLFSMRDSCLLIEVFKHLFPQYNAKPFMMSRVIMQRFCNTEYEEYVRNMYDDTTCIIYDSNGTFRSSKDLFMKLFGKLPRVHYFSFVNSAANRFDGLSMNLSNDIVAMSIECFNISTNGCVKELYDGNFSFLQNEFPEKIGFVYKETCEKFVTKESFDIVSYIEKQKPNIEQLNELIQLFCKENKEKAFIPDDYYATYDTMLRIKYELT